MLDEMYDFSSKRGNGFLLEVCWIRLKGYPDLSAFSGELTRKSDDVFCLGDPLFQHCTRVFCRSLRILQGVGTSTEALQESRNIIMSSPWGKKSSPMTKALDLGFANLQRVTHRPRKNSLQLAYTEERSSSCCTGPRV